MSWSRAVHEFVEEYEWIHVGLGVIGNATFFVGSIFFLPVYEAWMTLGVWLFITGSLLMLIGALGNGAVRLLRKRFGDPARATAAE